MVSRRLSEDPKGTFSWSVAAIAGVIERRVFTAQSMRLQAVPLRLDDCGSGKKVQGVEISVARKEEVTLLGCECK